MIIANQSGIGIPFFADIVLYLIGLGFTIGFSWICSVAVYQLNTEIYEDIKKEGFPTSFRQFHTAVSINLFLEVLVSPFLLLNIRYSLYFLRKIVSAFGHLTPFWKLTKVFHRAFLWTTKTISRQFGDFNTPTWAEGALSLVTRFCLCFNAVIWFPANPTFLVRFVRCFGAHILGFMAASVACAILAFYFLDYLPRLFHDTELGPFGFGHFLLCFYLGLFVVAACIGIVLCIRQVLLPFSQDLDNLSRDKLVLEF